MSIPAENPTHLDIPAGYSKVFELPSLDRSMSLIGAVPKDANSCFLAVTTADGSESHPIEVRWDAVQLMVRMMTEYRNNG